MLSNESTSIQAGSPLWVELKLMNLYQRLFSRIVLFCSRNRFVFFVFVSLFCASMFFSYTPIRNWLCSPKTVNFIYDTWVKQRMWPIVLLFMMGPLIWVSRKRSEVFNSLFYTVITLGFVFFNSFNLRVGIFRLLDFAMDYLFLVIPFIALFKKSFRAKVFFLMLSTVLLVFIEFYVRIKFPGLKNVSIFMQSGRIFIPLIYVFLEYRALGRSFELKDSKLLSYVFSPLMTLNPQPVSITNWKKPDDPIPVMLQGFVDFVAGVLGFFLSAFFLIYIEADPRLGHFLGIVVNGIRLSLAFLFASFGIFRFAVGLGRWFGYEIPDATNFAILAINPLDSWKRWSTYLYNWMLAVIYLPTLRKTKSNFIALFLAFFVLFMTHFPVSISLVGFWNYLPTFQKYFYLKNLLFFLAHGCLVAISFRFKNLWPDSDKRSGWWGVLVNRLLLGLIHAILLY